MTRPRDVLVDHLHRALELVVFVAFAAAIFPYFLLVLVASPMCTWSARRNFEKRSART